ncbi:hypothetical protein AB0469_15300 [Streptomyces sp. NPDC093801]|uniref:hypothetical protein n=1 Tax=Streptomyces sp. NPDC093801 TaxID=3155203 RepID=UPI00344C0170
MPEAPARSAATGRAPDVSQVLAACIRACIPTVVTIWRMDRWVVPAAPAQASCTKSAAPIVICRAPAGLRVCAGGFGGLDAGGAHGADQVGGGVAEQGPGGAEQRGRRGAEVASGGRGDREQGADPAVAPLDQGPVDEAGQQADGRRVVEHARRPVHHRDDHELRQGQGVQRGRDRHW